MKLYFSGSVTPAVTQRLVERGVCRLFTYAYPREPYEFLNLADSMGKRMDVMMDSGAFTAWNKGRPVQLQQLLDYHDRLLEVYGNKHDFTFIALDVIPGERGRAATPDDLKRGMDESMENYLRMKAHIPFPVMPVYHSGEPVQFRDALLEHTDHFCLSMSQDMSERQRVSWAMQAQVPGTKMHGLAATGARIMEYVDWYSVDSAGWLMTASMGSILWRTGTKLVPLSVSGNSPSIKDAGKHLSNRPDKRTLLATIEAAGYDPEALAADYVQRFYWNIDAWTNYQPRRNVHVEQGLFDL